MNLDLDIRSILLYHWANKSLGISQIQIYVSLNIYIYIFKYLLYPCSALWQRAYSYEVSYAQAKASVV